MFTLLPCTFDLINIKWRVNKHVLLYSYLCAGTRSLIDVHAIFVFLVTVVGTSGAHLVRITGVSVVEVLA